MDISSRTLKSPGVIVAALSAVSLGIVCFGLFVMLRPTTSMTPAEDAAAEAPVGDRRITALGRIEPQGGIYNVAAPSSLSASRVLQLQVEEGAQVKQGQVLAIMDSYEQLRAAAIQAEAQVREAQSNLEQVKAGEKRSDINAKLASARAEEVNVQLQQVNVDQQVANVNERLAAVMAKQAVRNRVLVQLKQAERDWKQAVDLSSQGALPEDVMKTREFEFLAKQAELEEAKAEIGRAEQQLEQAKRQQQQSLGEVLRREQQLAQATEQFKSAGEVRPEDLQRAEAGIQSALANLARAKAELDQAAVVAPIDGQVLEIHTTGGEAVGSQGILDLARTDRMTVVAEVYETDIRDIQVGQPATVTSPALATSLRGRVAQVGLKIDKKDVLDTDPAADTDARVVEVTVVLENSAPVASLTNLQVNVAINTAAPLLRPGPISGIDKLLGQPGDGFPGDSSRGTVLSPGLLQNGLLDNPRLNAPGQGEPSGLDGGES